MAKVTSKLQFTLPKRIAERHNIQPGDQIDFESSGAVIRIVPHHAQAPGQLGIEERLRLFDEASARQRARATGISETGARPKRRDWTREDLYTRGSTD